MADKLINYYMNYKTKPSKKIWISYYAFRR